MAAAAPHVLRAAGETPLLVNQLYESPATSRSEIRIREGRVETQWVDAYKHFLSALEGVEAGRVRQCPECRAFSLPCARTSKRVPGDAILRVAYVSGARIRRTMNTGAN